MSRKPQNKKPSDDELLASLDDDALLDSLGEAPVKEKPKPIVETGVSSLDHMLSPSVKRGGITGVAQFLKPSIDGALKALNYAGGLSTDAVLEGLKRASTGGQEGLGGEEWLNAAKGESTFAPELLQKKFGMNPVASYAVGFPLAVATDPTNYFFAGSGTGRRAVQAAPGIWSKLANLRNSMGTQAIKPISEGLNELGRRVFSKPLQATNAKVFAENARFHKYGKDVVSDALYNGGKPIVDTGSNESILQSFLKILKGTGEKLGIARGDASDAVGMLNYAPQMEEQALKAMVEHGLANGLDATTVAAMKPADAIPWLLNQLKHENPKQAQAALETLANGLPEELATVVREHSHLLKQSKTKQGFISELQDLVDEFRHGEMDIDEFLKKGGSWSEDVSGNTAMGTNKHTTVAKHDAVADFTKRIGGAMASMADKHLEPFLADATQYGREKKLYSVLSKAKVPVIRTVQKDMARPDASKVETFVMLQAMLRQDPLLAMTVLGTKAASELQRKPDWGMKAGALLGKASRTSVWDNIARKGLLEAVRPQPPQPEPDFLDQELR